MTTVEEYAVSTIRPFCVDISEEAIIRAAPTSCCSTLAFQ